MFVVVAKVLAPLTYPLGLSFLLWSVSAILHWRRQLAWSRRCCAGGIALVLIFSNPLVSDAFLGSLEDDFPVLLPEAVPRVDAIVVLGGVTSPVIAPRAAVEVGDGFDRLLHGIRLWRAGCAPLIVLSGGGIPSLVGSETPEAERLRILAEEQGVDGAALLLEGRSRNTHENALYTAQMLRQRGLQSIVLVTSAAHMRRAHAAFARQDVAAVPAPADVRVTPIPLTLVRLLPDADALQASSMAMKEYVGLLVYWLRGWV